MTDSHRGDTPEYTVQEFKPLGLHRLPPTELVEVESAMVLTQEEWDDMAQICAYYREHVVALKTRRGDIDRRHALCDRVIEAAR